MAADFDFFKKNHLPFKFKIKSKTEIKFFFFFFEIEKAIKLN